MNKVRFLYLQRYLRTRMSKKREYDDNLVDLLNNNDDDYI